MNLLGITSAKEVMFVVLFACLSVRKNGYVQCNEQICMKILPEVCRRPRTNPLVF